MPLGARNLRAATEIIILLYIACLQSAPDECVVFDKITDDTQCRYQRTHTVTASVSLAEHVIESTFSLQPYITLLTGGDKRGGEGAKMIYAPGRT